MHHIFGVLKLELTIIGLLLHLCYFGICVIAYIGLDYYTTNKNKFKNIVINNVNKLYNITCVCSFIQDYIFQIKPPF
jgi:hypothetical protein